MNISHDDAAALEDHFKRFPKDYRDNVSETFRNHALYLLESPNRKWTNENITAIKKILHDESMNWQREEVIQSLELVCQSYTLELLNIFPELLDNWFRSDFSDTKYKNIAKICITWFKNLLSKLGTPPNFIFSIFQQLERIYPLLGQRINIWRDLTDIAIERVKSCSEVQIFSSTKLISQIKHHDVKKLFLDMVKEILNNTVRQINDWLLNKIFIICDCKSKTLEVPNS
jgi:hypothetical protein